MRRDTQELWHDLNCTVEMLRNLLSSGPVALHEIHLICAKRKIKIADLNTARRSLGLKTIRKQGTGYWQLPSEG